MKKLTLALCCLFLLLSAVPTAAAADNDTMTGTVIYHNKEILSNGLTVVDEVIDLSLARATDKTAARTRTIKDGDTVIAVITIQATFRYDGSTVSVVSKSVTQADTYSGWSYSQNSFTSSGGTVTLEGTLNFLWLFNSTSFTMTLSCDKNGNIT